MSCKKVDLTEEEKNFLYIYTLSRYQETKSESKKEMLYNLLMKLR